MTRMNHNRLYLLVSFFWLFLLFVSTILLSPSGASAKSSKFRMEFVMNRVANAFVAQDALIKRSKDIMPGEIRSLIDDALSEERSFGDRMYLLDIAHAMSSGYAHHFDNENLLTEVKIIQSMTLEKENIRVREKERWEAYERLKGNKVMKEHFVKMEEEGKAPVLYPHWVHQLFFQCRVCHDDIFRMKRGANDISHSKFKEGKQCGVCHNGLLSFDVKSECERCHIPGGPQAARRYSEIEDEKINEAATRIGSGWNPKKPDEERLPLDSFGTIDFYGLEQDGVIEPVPSLEKGYKVETRDNIIVFKTKDTSFSDVAFSHRIHSERMDCATCHPKIFAQKLNGNELSMAEMAAGGFCGACHGTVSFPLVDCRRCHATTAAEGVEGALIHNLGN